MTLEQRLERLERQSRWMRRGGALALAVEATVILVGQGAEEDLRDLEARSLTLKDSDGRERLRIGPEFAEHGLRFMDATGETRARFYLQLDGTPQVFLYNAQGKEGIAFSVKDRPRLALLHAGVDRLSLKVGSDGSPGLYLFDAERKTTWQAPSK